MTTGTRSHSTLVIRSGVGLGRLARALRLLRVPRLERAMRVARVTLDRVLTDDLGGEFEAHAVRIEEIDRVDELVVGDPEHLDAVRLKPRLHGVERLHRGHLEG